MGSTWKSKISVAAIVAFGIVALCSPAAQAQTPRGGELKCMNDVVPSGVATATFFWTLSGVDVSAGQTFTCSPASPIDSQTVLQPAGADGWRIEVTLTSLACSNCIDVDFGTFDPTRAPHVHSRFTNFSEGTLVFTLSRNP